jgi:hypothetical protein
MPSQVTTIGDSLLSGLTTGFNSLIGFIPALLGAAIVLVIGWYLSSFVGRLLEKILHAAKLDSAAGRTDVSRYLTVKDHAASHAVGVLSKWFIFLIFIQAAANVISMPQVTAIINSIILYIPNVIVAMLILIIGALAAKFLSGVVEKSVAGMGAARSRVFSLIANYAVIGFAVIAALNQLGIATALVNTLFIGLIGSLSLAIGLAFGLGGQGVASEITRTWYEEGKASGGGRLSSVSGGSPTEPPRAAGQDRRR